MHIDRCKGRFSFVLGGNHMQVTVYWDLLWMINFTLDAALLACTVVMLANKLSWIRIILAAALGATYALCPLFVETEFLYHPAIKTLVALLLVALAVKHITMKSFFRSVALFYGLSFFAGGAATALSNMGVSNLEGSEAGLWGTGLALISAIAFTKGGFHRIRSVFLRSAGKVSLRVSIGGKSTETIAIFDTGNELNCPFTGKPIIVMNIETLHGMIPEVLKHNAGIEDISSLPDNWKVRLQFLPYAALGSKGMLTIIRPDKLEICREKQNYIEVHALIGLANKDFCQDKGYKALIGPQLLLS